jgi:hypothetical protein
MRCLCLKKMEDVREQVLEKEGRPEYNVGKVRLMGFENHGTTLVLVEI